MQAFLIPSGSAYENLNGTSHLFEHILISRFPKKLKGITTEDYIFCFGLYLNKENLLYFFHSFQIDEEELKERKRTILLEYEEHKNDIHEMFYKIIWNGTEYENSPLGRKIDIERLSVQDIVEYTKNLRNNPIYYFENNQVEIINNNNSKNSKIGTCYLYRVSLINFQGKNYNIFYFKNDISILYIIELLLQDKNPGRHIYISEKINKSVFIIQEKCIFPQKKELPFLIEKSLQKLINKKLKIKRIDLALSELESYYYYRKNIESRLKYLERIPINQIENTIFELLHKKEA